MDIYLPAPIEIGDKLKIYKGSLYCLANYSSIQEHVQDDIYIYMSSAETYKIVPPRPLQSCYRCDN